jgi:alcohol dehydrogenase class IV
VNSLLNFKTCGRLVMGRGALRELPGIVKQMGHSKALIVTDAGVSAAGIVRRAAALLSEAGIEFGVFDGVLPDPPIEVFDKCMETARSGDYPLFIGLGGGSSMDVAKMTAVMMTNDGKPAEYVGTGLVPRAGLDTILIPTTSGTGSEVTPIAIMSDKREHLKKGVVSDFLYSKVALVDPELTVSLPPDVTAYTGMDALAHVLEPFTNRSPNEFIDVFALQAMRLIGRNLRRAVSHPDDLDARTNMSMAALYGGLTISAVSTTACHALAYPLGGTFGVPHGITNALLLSHVIEFNAPSQLERTARIAEALGEAVDGLPTEEAAARGVEAVKRLARDIGVPARMRDLGVPEDAIPSMAAAAMKVTRLLQFNPREVTEADAAAIYRKAW